MAHVPSYTNTFSKSPEVRMNMIGTDRVPDGGYYKRCREKISLMKTCTVRQGRLTLIAVEYRDGLIIRIGVHNIRCIRRDRAIRFGTSSSTARGELWMTRSHFSAKCGHAPSKFACHLVHQSELLNIAGSAIRFRGHGAEQRGNCRRTWNNSRGQIPQVNSHLRRM